MTFASSATAVASSNAGSARGVPLIRHMDQLFQRADPWNYRTSPYEIRKRAVTLACLPQWRYASAFEPGCANGVLSEQLLARCDQLLCADASTAALGRAAEQVGARPGLTWRQMTVPDEWPSERFDLIVLSELLYYLDTPACQAVAQHCLRSLRPGGTLLACHWRQSADDFLSTGEISHGVLQDVFDASGDMSHVRMHREKDFLIDVWIQGRTAQLQSGVNSVAGHGTHHGGEKRQTFDAKLASEHGADDGPDTGVRS